jgi:hypothetical protein
MPMSNDAVAVTEYAKIAKVQVGLRSSCPAEIALGKNAIAKP